MNFYLASLGCPKNLVDSQGMTRQLKRLGHRSVAEPDQAQVLIVNTCGFIADAREESIRELRKLARRKRPDQFVIAAGCLSQRWGEVLAKHVPGLDGLLGTRRWSEIGSLISALYPIPKRSSRGPSESAGVLKLASKRPIALLDDPIRGLTQGHLQASQGERYARQGASAYLQIADGCSAPCAFCAIPLIKGPAASRGADEIVADAQLLVRQGVRELILIAQDTSAYGRDLGDKDALPGLLEAILSAVPHSPSGDGLGLHWLRLMYAYPGHVSRRLIETMAGDRRVCHYLDLPLQHAHPDVLRRMRRPSNIDRTRKLLDDLRSAMPDLALRTSFIVGYPGETEAEFQALLDFVADVGPDHVGAFLFSPEEGTFAATLSGAVPEAVKAERFDRLMALQQGISWRENQNQVGRVLDVLIEGTGDGLAVGRSYRDAPEIDGLVLVDGEQPLGEIVPVLISSATEYDLAGKAFEEGERWPGGAL